MTVHQDSVSNPRVMEPLEDESEEYAEARNDSLSLFGAALGGALLGMLLTLLVLAIINNGNLRFDTAAGSQRLLLVEDQIGVLDESVRNVNENVGIVSDNVTGQIDERFSTLLGEIEGQGLTISELGDTIAELEATSNDFDVFIAALNEALARIESRETSASATESTTETTDSATETSESAATEVERVSSIEPVVEVSEEVPANGVAVLVFRDLNGNNQFDGDEQAIGGLSVSLIDDAGETLSTATTGNAGLLFRNVDSGDYTLVVSAEDTDMMDGDALGEVTISDEGDGQLMYFPMSME